MHNINGELIQTLREVRITKPKHDYLFVCIVSIPKIKV